MKAISEAMPCKKILFVITGGESGGAQTHLFDLCTHMDKKFVPLVAIGSPGPLGDRLCAAGIAVYEVPALRRKIELAQDIKAYLQLQDLIQRLQPDLICTHSSKAGFLGRMASKRVGVPSIFTAHGWAFTEGVAGLQSFLYRHLEWLAGHWCDKIICVSEYDFQLALKARIIAAEKMAVIHNGLTPAPYPADKVTHPEHVPRIIMVARFSAQKDYRLLLQVISELDPDMPIMVDLVGDGPLRKSCMELAARLNLLDRVNFLGDRADVPDLLKQADIFVLTSHWEGFPITILEAMRAGLPVIASDVGGCREAVIDGSTGFLVTAGDPKSLQSYLEVLLADQELRVKLGRAGYMSFINHFTIDKMIDKTMNVYKEVLHLNG
ncbi:MAG: glycosyltransferase family 4 protein [Syntrophomonadaceae bacterium]